jgi:hypothetical protein
MEKFEAAKAIFELMESHNIEKNIIQSLSSHICAIELRLMLSISHLYITAASGEIGRQNAVSEFFRIMTIENIVKDVDSLVRQSEAIFRKFATNKKQSNSRAEIQRRLKIYPWGELSHQITKESTIEYEKCPTCGLPMTADTGNSELLCRECGTVRELVGIVFDDTQFYNQEGQKAKSGTFNPNRHFQYWWTHILARESEDELGDKSDPNNTYGQKILSNLRAIVQRDHKILRLLTVNDVRAMLREVSRTDLNKNVPLILKKLTGVGPPSMPDEVSIRVENLFTKALESGEHISREGRTNRNYYPFYIFKILEQILPEKDIHSRRVLYYFYIQSRETVEADDEDWEHICADVPELKYKPTDRSLGMKYVPTD